MPLQEALSIVEKCISFLHQINKLLKSLQLPEYYSVHLLKDLYQAEIYLIQGMLFNEETTRRGAAIELFEKARKIFTVSKNPIGVARSIIGEAKCRLEYFAENEEIKVVKNQLKVAIKAIKECLASGESFHENLLGEAYYYKGNTPYLLFNYHINRCMQL